MENYKELVDWCKRESSRFAVLGNCSEAEKFTKMGRAITELLDRAEKAEQERDEAVGQLSDFPNPRTRKNSDRCEHISAVTGRPFCRGCEEWEWNGGREK